MRTCCWVDQSGMPRSVEPKEGQNRDLPAAFFHEKSQRQASSCTPTHQQTSRHWLHLMRQWFLPRVQKAGTENSSDLHPGVVLLHPFDKFMRQIKGSSASRSIPARLHHMAKAMLQRSNHVPDARYAGLAAVARCRSVINSIIRIALILSRPLAFGRFRGTFHQRAPI